MFLASEIRKNLRNGIVCPGAWLQIPSPDVAELDPDAGAACGIVLVAQIEHVNALKEPDAIFSHPRLDAYMVGRYDFSASMGLAGDFAHQDFLAVEETIRNKAAIHRLPAGFHVRSPNQDEFLALPAKATPFWPMGSTPPFS